MWRTQSHAWAPASPRQGRRGPLGLSRLTRRGCGPERRACSLRLSWSRSCRPKTSGSGLGGWLCKAGLRGGGRAGGEGGRGSWGSRGWSGWGWKESPGLRWFLEVSHICSRGAGVQCARGVLKSHTHRGSAHLPVFSAWRPV